MKPPTVEELTSARAACIADEKTAEWYDYFSKATVNSIEVADVLRGTIFMPGSLALGIELGIRIMEARNRAGSTNESDAELKRRVGL